MGSGASRPRPPEAPSSVSDGPLTWIDAAALGIIVLSALFSMVRGFVREVLSIFAWAGALLAALKLFPYVEPEVASLLPQKNLVVFVSIAAIFIVTLIVLSVVSAAIGGLVRGSALSQLDRTLGLVFGAVRGAVIVCIAYIGLSIGLPQAEWPAPVVNARLLPAAYDGAALLAGLLPPEYRPVIAAPPTAPAPSAGALMRQPVAGSAL